jgi:hypothetical protein
MFLALVGGTPSYDMFRRVFALFDRWQFSACLFPWTQTPHDASGGKRACKQLCVDFQRPVTYIAEIAICAQISFPRTPPESSMATTLFT